ncbi:MAG: GntR family transcriptional regulator [Clostridia bacterium]|nr:GntR family transcriptional regulator [Clostridia bacterium]
MFEKDLGLLPLFDVYGAMLGEQKQKMFELYYGDDLSLSEIAEEMNISRQGVREALKKCEEQLLDFEDKLGFAKKISSLEKNISSLEELDLSGEEREKLDGIIENLRKITE